ncbi:MAG: hypothetical protein JWM77_2830 [Rhodospirillales bacterium]|nr:hypothetical protein [Rhodospirillales bacterium]
MRACLTLVGLIYHSRMRCFVPLLLVFLALPVLASEDWPARTRADLEAVRGAVIADHPGWVWEGDPTFRARTQAAFDIAMREADAAHDAPSSCAIVRRLIARFDDGHVGMECRDKTPDRWPRLLPARDPAGVWRIALSRRDDVPIGMRLLACDGVPVETLYADRVRPLVGRWELESQRVQQAGRLLLDEHDPLSPPPRRCAVEQDGRTRTIELTWEAIEWKDWVGLHNDILGKAPPIGIRRVVDGGWWITLSSSYGANTDRARRRLIADVRRHIGNLRHARYIVFDVRGNAGGNSSWGETLARLLWGADFIAATQPDLGHTLWRATPTILAQNKEIHATFAARGDEIGYLEPVLNGLERAIAAGDTFFEERNEVREPPTHAPRNPVQGGVFLLTDMACASACLDFADLVLAMPGAVQLGWPTSADTLYMDVRTRTLDGERVRLILPNKIWPDRPRRSNVPYVPAQRWTGDPNDQAGLQRWIRTLAEASR